jgi:hypothetical protein
MLGTVRVSNSHVDEPAPGGALSRSDIRTWMSQHPAGHWRAAAFARG